MNKYRNRNKEKLFTLYEVSEILKVSYGMVMDWVNSGKLKAKTIGRLWIVEDIDFLKFLNDEEYIA